MSYSKVTTSISYSNYTNNYHQNLSIRFLFFLARGSLSERDRDREAEKRKGEMKIKEIKGGSTEGLLSGVVDSLLSHEKHRQKYMAMEEAELARAEEIFKSSGGRINVRGYLDLERKHFNPSAPKNNGQPRYKRNYFKLTSIKNKMNIFSEDGNEDVDMATFRPFTYIVSWYASSKNTSPLQQTFNTDAIYSVYLADIPYGLQLVYVDEEEVMIKYEDLQYSSEYKEDLSTISQWGVEGGLGGLDGEDWGESDNEGDYDSEGEGGGEGSPSAVVQVRLKTRRTRVRGRAESGSADPKVWGSQDQDQENQNQDQLSSPKGRRSQSFSASLSSGKLSMLSGGSTPSSSKYEERDRLSDDSYLCFCLVMVDGAKHVLRTHNIGKGVRWINSLALAASMGYDREQKEWNRESKIVKIALAKQSVQKLEVCVKSEFDFD